MTFLMDYEGYTFVFFIKKINKFFFSSPEHEVLK